MYCSGEIPDLPLAKATAELGAAYQMHVMPRLVVGLKAGAISLCTMNINAIALVMRPEQEPPRGDVPNSLGSSTAHMTAWHRHPLCDVPRTFVSYNNLLEICLFPCSSVIVICQCSSRHWVLSSNPGTRADFFPCLLVVIWEQNLAF